MVFKVKILLSIVSLLLFVAPSAAADFTYQEYTKAPEGERKDRVDDAMHATRAAVEEGILPGGGVALLRASEALKKVRTHNDDQKTGVEIVRKAISWPARQIAINAGEDGSIVVGKILEKDTYAYGSSRRRSTKATGRRLAAPQMWPCGLSQSRPDEQEIDSVLASVFGSVGRTIQERYASISDRLSGQN